ncbi:MAG: hypothetical protein GC192_14190 [Bacteroidetes bacterium]|nr:hypothetical protein [Bacteroidota bacterium]
MTLPLYPCSQSVFVVTVNTALDSLEEYLASFTAFKPKYVQAWVDALRAELLAAEILPDEDARRAASEIMRVQLVALNRTCCELWQRLKRYITDAYPANIVDIQLAAAGQSKYAAAYNENWSEAKAMYTSAINFMADNLADLTADGNMPPAFPATFTTEIDAFNALLSDYESSKENIPVATQTKITAFNNVYRQTIAMMLDGQEIFKNNPAVLTQFVFAHVVERTTSAGQAGARGTVTSNLDDFPIVNAVATLTLASNPAVSYTAITNAEGKYLNTCPSGNYKLRFTAENYLPSAVKDVTIAVGTVSTYNEKLVPVDTGE